MKARNVTFWKIINIYFYLILFFCIKNAQSLMEECFYLIAKCIFILNLNRQKLD